MIEHTDRRRFSRVNFITPVTITQGEKLWHSELLDISLKGILIHGKLPDECDKNEQLTAMIELSDQTLICMLSRFVHEEKNQTGLACVSIDVDSIAHLRRLIELNLGDAKAAERELIDLIPSLQEKH